MKLKDETVWQTWNENNQDAYGKAIMDYAERWADLMESLMAGGAKLEDIARQASHDADVEGITGFMYGAAVSVLASCWQCGDQLRRWHNPQYQLKDEGERANESGGVLNPAILNIGTQG